LTAIDDLPILGVDFFTIVRCRDMLGSWRFGAASVNLVTPFRLASTTMECACNMDADSQHLLDYLIRNSGLFSRQILKLARRLYLMQQTVAGQRNSPLMRSIRWLGAAILFVFTYYVGGSLTRSDQHTLARMKGMPSGHAYRLTLYNAVFFGIPCAFNYFLLGEGFRLLSTVNSLVELPALLTKNLLFSIGLISLAVDLFRMADAAWHRRCWAPFGLMPFIINFPTYLKIAHRRYVQGKTTISAQMPPQAPGSVHPRINPGGESKDSQQVREHRA
jgi:hypothetical protein